jgi:DtxR family Mn-dependent transcriptional regulator
MYSEAVEDYLKAIYELESEFGKVSTSDLAHHLGVAPASVSSMLMKLKDLRLVTHRRYKGARLTEVGRMKALAVIRHHRLAETFLAESLGVPLEEIHTEAHRWEHVLTESVARRLESLLGHPTADPHGAPIPTRDGKIVLHNHPPLADLQPGQTAIVAEISDRDPDLLRYLADLGLLPRTKLRVVARHPCDGPLTIQVRNKEYTVGPEVTRRVFVRVIEVVKSAPGTELPEP